MTFDGILQIVVYLVLLTVLAKPMGVYLLKVYSGEHTFLAPLFRPVERIVYKLTRVDTEQEMNWKQYGIAMLVFSLISTLVLYGLQRMQFYLPGNPQSFAGLSEHLSFNTAVSFVTNTN
ncbi:MAG: potassium-transporting ATPase subunit KdpA, partial [Pyrinomonadaceae bacterium]